MYTRVWKCTVIFSWMLNTEPHSCIWGGASKYLAPALCLSVRLSVTRCYHAKKTQARIMESSLEDSPMTLVSSWLTSPQNSKANIGSEGAKWERGRKNRQFLANKSPYLENGARQDYGHNDRLIGSRIRAFDWYQNHRPWMTLKDLERPKRTLVQKRCVFWSPLHKFE